MNRNILGALAAGFVAIAALAAPAQAGYRSHHHGHGYGHRHHVTKFFHAHKFHGYRKAYHVPVCVKHKWVYSYSHGKKLVCVLWH